MLTAKDYETGRAEIEDVRMYDMKHVKKMPGRPIQSRTQNEMLTAGTPGNPGESGRPSQNGPAYAKEDASSIPGSLLQDNLSTVRPATGPSATPDKFSVRDLVTGVKDAFGEKYAQSPVASSLPQTPEETRQLVTRMKEIPPAQWSRQDYESFKAYMDRVFDVADPETWGLRPDEAARLQETQIDPDEPTTWPDREKAERYTQLDRIVNDPAEDPHTLKAFLEPMEQLEERNLENTSEYKALEQKLDEHQRAAEKEMDDLYNEMEEVASQGRAAIERFGENLYDRLNSRLENAPTLWEFFRHPENHSLPSILEMLKEAEATPAEQWSPELRERMADFYAGREYRGDLPYWGSDVYDNLQNLAAFALDASTPTTWLDHEATASLGYEALDLEKDIALSTDAAEIKELRAELAQLKKEAKPIIRELEQEFRQRSEADRARLDALDEKVRKLGLNNLGLNKETYPQRMYHGSPHRFGVFRMSEVGKGEGTQVEGYGMYFTVDRNTAEVYRMRNSGPRSFQDYLQGLYARDEAGNWVDRSGTRLDENMRFVLDKLEGNITAYRAWDPEALGANLNAIENEYRKLLTPEEMSQVRPALERIREETRDLRPQPVGQTYEVEGPEDSALLNRDLPLSRQPKDVAAILKENGLFENPDLTGKELYDDLSKRRGGAQQASRYLNSLGIPGATFDLAGKKTFVVWNEQELEVLAKLYPEAREEMKAAQEGNRAQISFTADGETFIDLFGSADASSLFHEFGHKVLHDFARFGSLEHVSAEYRRDFRTTFEYLGITPDEYLNDAGKRRDAQEKFAKSFEAYLAEGRAPSKEMRGVFKRLKTWLLEIYHDVQQALGVDLSDEIRGVFDRLLAAPEQIDAEIEARTKVKDLAVEHAVLKDQIKALERKAREAGAQGLGFVERDALRKLREKEKFEAVRKHELKQLVTGIEQMAGSENIRWGSKKEIEKLLADYDLKRRNKGTLERRAELEAYLADNPEAGDSMNPKDLQYLGLKTLNDMTVEDLRNLNAEVRALYEQGQREFAAWEAERKQRVDRKFAELAKALMKKKVDRSPIQMSVQDAKKQYKGIRGRLEKSKDWGYAATLGAQRFFDWLDGGGARYQGAFVKHFMDEFNGARDAELRRVFERRNWMQEQLRELGLDMQDFSKVRARNIYGKDFTVDQIMEIYIGLRNAKKAAAIRHGVFGQVPGGTVAHLVAQLTPEEKRAAELVPMDHEMHVDRIESAFIEAFNKGFEREEHYTSIHRVEHGSPQGLIDAESAEALAAGIADAGFMKHIEDGFTKSRVVMKDENQSGIKLGLFSNWHDDVSRHEHSAAFANLARETAGALMSRNPADERVTLGKMIKERFGDEAWRTLVDYFNIAVTDDTRMRTTSWTARRASWRRT